MHSGQTGEMRSRSTSPRQRPGTVSTTWPAFGPHSDSGSTASPQQHHDHGDPGQDQDQEQPRQTQEQHQVTGLERYLLPPHELPREVALRDAGALVIDDVPPSPTSAQTILLTCALQLGQNQPRGPKDQKKSRFRSRLKISIENEIFERATHRSPIFCGEIETSRLKCSSEIKNFDRD